MMDVPQKRLKAKQNIVTLAFAGFIVRKCQIEGQQLYLPKLLEVLVMIRLLWLSTKVLFLVYGKAQEQSKPKAFKLSFMPAKHTRKVSLLEDLTTKIYVDCHPDFVSGLRVTRLLGFPKLASGTVEAQLELLSMY